MWAAALGKERFHGAEARQQTADRGDHHPPAHRAGRRALAAVDRRDARAGRAGRRQRLRFALVRRSHLLPGRHPRSAAAAGAGGRGQPAPDARHVGLPLAAAPSGAGRQAGGDARPPERRPLHLRGRRGRRVRQGVRGLRRADQRARAPPHRSDRHSAQAVDAASRRATRGATTAPSTMCRCSRRRGSPAARRSGAADARTARCARAGRLADGWIAYAITPEMFKTGLEQDRAGGKRSRTRDATFGTGHLLFTRLDDTYEKALDAATATLSQRYAMDFRRAAERYAALGSPQQVADRIRAFHAAGARHITLDLVGPYEERDRQIDRSPATCCRCSRICDKVRVRESLRQRAVDLLRRGREGDLQGTPGGTRCCARLWPPCLL